MQPTAALLALLLATGATFLSTFLSAPLPDDAGYFSWWYLKDHPVDTTADGAQQTTVRIRSGQWQGFAIGIFNSSSFTETIIGRPTGENVDVFQPEVAVRIAGHPGPGPPLDQRPEAQQRFLRKRP